MKKKVDWMQVLCKKCEEGLIVLSNIEDEVRFYCPDCEASWAPDCDLKFPKSIMFRVEEDDKSERG